MHNYSTHKKGAILFFFTVKIVNTSDFLEHGVYILDLLLVE